MASPAQSKRLLLGNVGSDRFSIFSRAVKGHFSQYQRRGVLNSIQAEHPAMICSVRHFAEVSSPPPEEKDPLKRIFFNMMKKYKTMIGELMKTKITLDPEDPKAVVEYKATMDSARKKVGAPSITQKIAMFIEREAQAAPDMKTFLKSLQKLKENFGVKEEYEGDKMMLEAVEKVEKKIGRPLTRQDAEGMALLKKEFEAINKKLGVNPGMLKDLEVEFEHACAKAELEYMKEEVVETIETHKKRLELENIQVDLRKLDHRNFM